MLIFDTDTRVIFDWHFCKLSNNCDCRRHIKRRALYRETESYFNCHITRQASINAHASVRFPI